MSTTFVNNFVSAIQPALELIDQAGATIRLVSGAEFRQINDKKRAPEEFGVETKGVVDKVSDFIVATGNAAAGSMKVMIRNDSRLISTEYTPLYLEYPSEFDLVVQVPQYVQEALEVDGEPVRIENPSPSAGTRETIEINGEQLTITQATHRAYKDLTSRIVPGAHILHRGLWYRVMNLVNFEVGDAPVLAFELVIGRQRR